MNLDTKHLHPDVLLAHSRGRERKWILGDGQGGTGDGEEEKDKGRRGRKGKGKGKGEREMEKTKRKGECGRGDWRRGEWRRGEWRRSWERCDGGGSLLDPFAVGVIARLFILSPRVRS